MATLTQRPFSKNYSGLINQSVIAVVIVVICVTSHEIMKRKRRGTHLVKGLGSVESWEFGYLYQGRSWAQRPSPPHPRGWPLSWVKEVLSFPEDRMNQLRGVDATLYVRFLRGCFWFTLLHTFTTLPILFPIHVTFSDGSVSSKSMTRASISSLVLTAKGLSLLWIHVILLWWISLTWMGTLYWICHGAFWFRAKKIQAAADRVAVDVEVEKHLLYAPHPHPQLPFYTMPTLDNDNSHRGLRYRTVMVTNIPPSLRSEKELQEYFEYWLSRPVAKPSMGITSTTPPGFLNRWAAFLFNRSRHMSARLRRGSLPTEGADLSGLSQSKESTDFSSNPNLVPVVDRVVIVRQMTELASLLERREEVLRCLETAHVKLAKKALAAVAEAVGQKSETGLIHAAKASVARTTGRGTAPTDVEHGVGDGDNTAEGEDRMQLLIRTLRPYLPKSQPTQPKTSVWLFWRRKYHDNDASFSPAATPHREGKDVQIRTIWEALLSLPRPTLDAYQPLIHLSSLFRGKTVPSIDYYTTKLNILTALITEMRAKAPTDYVPMSTAFVTFADPGDARRARKFLAVHPNNPLTCLVTMAPSFEDLDWNRLMKSTFRAEFVKDWVVDVGVWAFTIFWVFPVSLFVGLVSIQNISAFWPGLKRYLDQHPWEEELIQSFVPTILVALLTLLIPMILLLIAKKAHTIGALSAMHDRIMTRYYKFLVVNVLVFFCVGTVALQSFLVSFKSTTGLQLIQAIADSFPSAGPFYVGWLIFTSAMHGGSELALFGLPLILYPATKRQVVPRKRAVGIRPRTFNYYYWLPNHLLVIHVFLVFCVLNPLVIPFGFLYFSIQTAIIKNQLLHVYAKNYEGNGRSILIRLIRYSCDGLMLSQAVFLAYMVVLKKTPHVAAAGVLIVLTAMFKLILTRVCRSQYERDDILEAQVVCGTHNVQQDSLTNHTNDVETSDNTGLRNVDSNDSAQRQFWTWRVTSKLRFSYATVHRPRRAHLPNPFGPSQSRISESDYALYESSSTAGLLHAVAEPLQDNPTTESQGTALVSVHPHHACWDDESRPDHTYDNPYFHRVVRDVLWLPRDPLGILDLDNTIDLNISITSEPGAGRLGALDDEDMFIASSLLSPFAASYGSISQLSLTTSPLPIDGSEEIALPFGIAARVGSIEHERDAETVVRPRTSHFNSRTYNQSSGRPSLGIRRPSKMEDGPNSSFRKFSFGSASNASPHGSPPSFLSTSGQHRRNRSRSVDQASAIQPHSFKHGSSGPRSLTVLEIPPHAATGTTRSYGTSSVITTHEALVSEAIVEEQEAAQERLREEAAEAEKASAPRSVFTSWMYAKPP